MKKGFFLKRFFSQEWAKLKEMNFQDKRWYIWEYYRVHIILYGFGLFILGSLINVLFINPPPRQYLYIAWQGNAIHTSHLDSLGERLSVILPERGYRIMVQSYVLVNDPQIDEALIMRYSAMIITGDLHLTITTSQGILEGAEFDMLRPPIYVLDIIREYNADFADYLYGRLLSITYTPPFVADSPEITEYMGIRIGGAPILVDSGITAEDLYLGIIVNSTRLDETARALMAMFDIYIPRPYTYTY